MGTNVCKTLKLKKSEFTDMLVNRIEGATIENRDALIILKSRNVPKAFHYIDSPYPNTDQGHYKGYTWEDYENLLKSCETITGKFLISGYNSEMLDAYVTKNNWIKKEIDLPLTANNRGDKKNNKRKIEVLVRNYDNTHGTMKMF